MTEPKYVEANGIDCDLVVPMVTGEHYAGEVNVCCPKCGHDYSRVRGVYFHGDCEIYMDGECGHRWSLKLNFHKGITLIQYAMLSNNPEYDNVD